MSGTNAELRDLFLKGTDELVAEKPTIKSLNFSHEAIIRWLLANPEKVAGGRLKACADAFGYTPGWLSIIIHSDAFQAKFRELSEEADSLVLNDIPAKMRGTASLALDGLAAQVETAVADQTVAPRDFLLKSSEMLLKSLGYGQGNKLTINQGPGSTAQVAVGSDDLARARARLTTPRVNEQKLLSAPTDPTS
jgi:hypothetical protein